VTRTARWSASLAAGALALSLAACGAGSQAGSQAGGKAGTCDVDSPSAAQTVDVLAYSSPSMDNFSGAMKACAVDKLTVKHSPVDFAAQLEKAQLSLSQAEGTYDVVEVYSATLSQYAGQGWLAPLDDFYKKYGERYKLNDIDPALLEFAKYDGKLYAIPMMVNVHVMVYRKDIFDKLGLKPPTTLPELAAAAKAIQDSGEVKSPLALTYSADADISTAYNNSLRSLGGEWIDPATDEVLLTSPQSVAAVESLKTLTPYMAPDHMSANNVANVTRMQNGEAAIAIMYTGSMAAIDDPKKSKFAGKFGFAAPPSVEAGGGAWATLNLDGFAVAKNSPVGVDVLGQVAAVGGGAGAAKAAGRLAFPARMSVRDDPELAKTAPHWAAGTASIKAGARPYPQKPYFLPLQVAVRPFLADAVSGKTPVKEALAQAQAAAEKIVAASK